MGSSGTFAAFWTNGGCRLGRAKTAVIAGDKNLWVLTHERVKHWAVAATFFAVCDQLDQGTF